jgi:hypothetical protein
MIIGFFGECESRAGRLTMETFNLKSLSLDELWALHEKIASVLSTKMQAEKLKLNKRLNEEHIRECVDSHIRPYPNMVRSREAAIVGEQDAQSRQKVG